MHACSHLHAHSCLGVFVHDVSPPKIPSPFLSTHLHSSHPSNLCLSHIWSHKIIKLLSLLHLCFLFSPHELLHHSREPLQTPQCRRCAPSTLWRLCPCLLLVTFSNLGQVPGCPLGQSPPAWSWRGLNSYAKLLFCPTSGFYCNSLSSGGAEGAERPCGFAFDNVQIVSKNVQHFLPLLIGSWRSFLLSFVFLSFFCSLFGPCLLGHHPLIFFFFIIHCDYSHSIFFSSAQCQFLHSISLLSHLLPSPKYPDLPFLLSSLSHCLPGTQLLFK